MANLLILVIAGFFLAVVTGIGSFLGGLFVGLMRAVGL